MRANGLTIFKKETEKRHGKTALSMRANIDKDKSMVMDGTYGVTAQPTLVIGSTTKSTDQESTRGLTTESTPACGKRTRCMATDT